MFMAKTKKNLQTTKKASVMAFRLSTNPVAASSGFQVKGTFLGFQRSGPIYDLFAAQLREMGMPCRGVGTIAVDEVWSVTQGESHQVS